MMPSFKWAEYDYCRNAHQQSDRFLSKKLQIEPSQHKHLFLVVVLWINSVYGYYQSKAWLLWFRQVCWLCFQLVLWLQKALLAFLPHQFHNPCSWKDQCVSLRSPQLCSSIKLKSKSLWNPMMGNKGAQSCSTEPILKKIPFKKQSSDFHKFSVPHSSQVLASLSYLVTFIIYWKAPWGATHCSLQCYSVDNELMKREAQSFELQEEIKRYFCGRKEAGWKKLKKVPTQYKKGALVPISCLASHVTGVIQQKESKT